MVDLSNVTLTSVSSVEIDRFVKALEFSRKDIKFGDTIFVTHADINPPNIKIIKTDYLDYIAYSKYIVYELHKHINTEFALLIQGDGFIVNPDKWVDEFLKYDYIGAPFPIPPENDKISYRDPFNNLIRVGNGGFSLRSKKILSLASELDLEWKSYFGYHNEDGFYAVHNRHIYEENGCVFAPVDVAAKFSHEKQTNETVGIEPFGFHGKNNKFNSLI